MVISIRRGIATIMNFVDFGKRKQIGDEFARGCARRLQVEGLGEAWSPQELNSSVHQREEQVRGGIFVSNACRKKAHLVRRQGSGQGIKEPAPPQLGTVCISPRTRPTIHHEVHPCRPRPGRCCLRRPRREGP